MNPGHSFYIHTSLLLFLFSFTANSQPAIQFSDASHFRNKPVVIGKTLNAYFCLYPADTLSTLVIYNQDMQEKSRLHWDSIVSEKTTISYQVFTARDKLSILLKEKTINGVQLKAIDIGENGGLIGTNILFADTIASNQQAKNYEVEISKNGKYILLYRGTKMDEEQMLLDGALFDNNWTLLKSFNYLVEKNNAEDSWYGAMVDIAGNIHTLVFTAYDNWRLGTKIRVHTIAMQTDEMKIEQIEVRRKRLFNYTLREDTSTHSIQLQAIVLQQHNKDPLNGIGFLSFPYIRTGRIFYSSYEFTSEQKRSFTKGLIPVRNLLKNSDIQYGFSYSQGGSFFTSFFIIKEKDAHEQIKKVKASTYDGSFATTNLPPNQSFSGQNDFFPNRAMPYSGEGNQAVFNPRDVNWNSFFFTNNQSLVRAVILKNSPNGKLEFLEEKNLRKGSPNFYGQNFSIIKDNSLHMLSYLLEEKGPALYMISDNRKSEMIKVRLPGNQFLFLQEARIVSDDTCLLPYFEPKTQCYGLAKAVF